MVRKLILEIADHLEATRWTDEELEVSKPNIILKLGVHQRLQNDSNWGNYLDHKHFRFCLIGEKFGLSSVYYAQYRGESPQGFHPLKHPNEYKAIVGNTYNNVPLCYFHCDGDSGGGVNSTTCIVSFSEGLRRLIENVHHSTEGGIVVDWEKILRQSVEAFKNAKTIYSVSDEGREDIGKGKPTPTDFDELSKQMVENPRLEGMPQERLYQIAMEGLVLAWQVDQVRRNMYTSLRGALLSQESHLEKIATKV